MSRIQNPRRQKCGIVNRSVNDSNCNTPKTIQGHKTAYLYRTHNPEHTIQENILEHEHTIQGKAKRQEYKVKQKTKVQVQPTSTKMGAKYSKHSHPADDNTHR